MEYKRIKHVRFLFKIKNSKIYVSLRPTYGGAYEIPYSFVEKGGCTFKTFSKEIGTKDRDNFEIWYMELSNIHQSKDNVWFDVLSLFDDNVLPRLACEDILSVVIDNFNLFNLGDKKPTKTFTDYYDEFKRLKLEECKESYIREINYYLSGNTPVICDGVYRPMNNELLNKELETLEHFNPEVRKKGAKYSDYYYSSHLRYEDFEGKVEPFGFKVDFLDLENLIDDLIDNKNGKKED